MLANMPIETDAVGQFVDDAMAGIERDNPSLKGVLPKDYARPALDKIANNDQEARTLLPKLISGELELSTPQNLKDRPT